MLTEPHMAQASCLQATVTSAEKQVRARLGSPRGEVRNEVIVLQAEEARAVARVAAGYKSNLCLALIVIQHRGLARCHLTRTFLSRKQLPVSHLELICDDSPVDGGGGQPNGPSATFFSGSSGGQCCLRSSHPPAVSGSHYQSDPLKMKKPWQKG